MTIDEIRNELTKLCPDFKFSAGLERPTGGEEVFTIEVHYVMDIFLTHSDSLSVLPERVAYALQGAINLNTNELTKLVAKVR